MINAKSQLDKRVDGLGGSGGGKISGGQGVYIDTPDGGVTSRVNIYEANAAAGSTGLGGVRINPSAEANTGLTAVSGTYSHNGVFGVRNASSKLKGAITLGDGLCPASFIYDPLKNTGSEQSVVQVRLGDGLEYAENPEAIEGTIEDNRNTYGGRPIAVAAGQGLGIDGSGKLKVNVKGGILTDVDNFLYTAINKAGNGITIISNITPEGIPYDMFQVRIGTGLAFSDEGALMLDDSGEEGGFAAGDGIIVSTDPDTNETVISVKLGIGLEFDDSGAIKTTGTGGAVAAGNGIDIGTNPDTGADVISAKLGEGLEFGEGGEINALTNIENAVVISEAQAKYLLHNYTQVEYLSGNKIGYAGPENQVIVQGFIANYGNNATAAREGTRYTGGKLTTFSGATVTEKEITVEIFTSTPESTVYRIYVNGTQAGSYTTYNPEVIGFVIQWENINGTKTEAAPYGYAYVSLYALSEGSTGTIGASAITGLTRVNVPFISEAEYNAAVGLTYEPNTLTEVQETVTEV